jgi:hypothetical protein
MSINEKYEKYEKYIKNLKTLIDNEIDSIDNVIKKKAIKNDIVAKQLDEIITVSIDNYYSITKNLYD